MPTSTRQIKPILRNSNANSMVPNGAMWASPPTDIPEVHGTFARADRVVRPYEEQCVLSGGKKLDRLSPGQRPGLLWDLEEGVQY